MAGDQELVRLRDQMEQTKALYEGAKAEYDLAIERVRDLGMTHPDGSVQHATKAFTHALQNYRTALMDYNRFVLDRMSPSLEGLQGSKKESGARLGGRIQISQPSTFSALPG